VISGFYGMNFLHTWPPFDSDWGVLFVLTLMLIALVSIILVMRYLERN
jgi:Mg2+ and Co2+ transporter CorA